MRAIVFVLGVSAALLVARPVQAQQFANHSFGLGVGYLKLNQDARLDWGIPFGISYLQYWDSGFEGVAHAYVMFVTEPVTQRVVFSLIPQIGVRYLFAQESIRPYVELNISYFHIFYDQAIEGSSIVKDYFGPGAALGVDFFVTDSVSIGLRAQYSLYVQLNQPVQSSLGGTVEAATYF